MANPYPIPRKARATDQRQNLVKQAKFESLPFNPGENVLDHGNRVAEDANRWLELQEPDFAEAYIGGDLELCIGYDAGVEPGYVKFLSFLVPPGGLEQLDLEAGNGRDTLLHQFEELVTRNLCVDFRLEEGHSHPLKESMGFNIPCLVDGIEQLVPVLVTVRLVRQSDVDDFLRDVFAASAPDAFNFFAEFREGEMRAALQWSATGGFSAGVTSVVKRVSQVSERVSDRKRKIIRDRIVIPDEIDGDVGVVLNLDALGASIQGVPACLQNTFCIIGAPLGIIEQYTATAERVSDRHVGS